MALVRCLLCNHEVSGRRLSCPDCGFPLKAATPQPRNEPAPRGATRSRRGLGIALALSGVAVSLGSLLPWTAVSGGLFGTVSVGSINDGDAIFLVCGAALTLIGALATVRGPSRTAGIAALAMTAASALVWYIDLTNVLEVLDIVNSPQEPFASGSLGAGMWFLAIGLYVSFVGASGIAGRTRS